MKGGRYVLESIRPLPVSPRCSAPVASAHARAHKCGRLHVKRAYTGHSCMFAQCKTKLPASAQRAHKVRHRRIRQLLTECMYAMYEKSLRSEVALRLAFMFLLPFYPALNETGHCFYTPQAILNLDAPNKHPLSLASTHQHQIVFAINHCPLPPVSIGKDLYQSTRADISASFRVLLIANIDGGLV